MMMSAAELFTSAATSPARRPGESGRRAAKEVVGARGFEPPTSRSRTVRATRLRYAPIRPAYCTYLASRVPGVLSHQLHELALTGRFGSDVAAHALDHGEHLILGAAHGEHHSPAIGELGDQRRRDRRPARGDQNAVERRLSGPAEGAVADAYPHIIDAERLQRGAGAIGEQIGRAHV